MNIAALIGQRITHTTGLEPYNDTIDFICATGRRFRMTHQQDCCETVELVEIIGDPADLIGLVLDAREDTNDDLNPNDLVPPRYFPDSWTWTFYTVQTDRGTVTLRWLGTSNGYYSERVDFDEIL